MGPVLLLAPHPFYVERGTPIAVRLLAERLVAMGCEVDLVTFPEGEDPGIAGCRILRVPQLPGLGPVPIGFSPQKVVADLFLTARAIRCLRSRGYAAIHAVEESIYPALLLGSTWRVPVIYDLDSSMADQLIEKWSGLACVGGLLHFAERLAIIGADGLAPVCRALEARVRAVVAGKPVELLHDVFSPEAVAEEFIDSIRDGLPDGARILLYVGNLEHYQGVDLVIDAVPRVDPSVHLVVIGGDPERIELGRSRAEALGVGGRVQFLGPRPPGDLNGYLAQADVLVSPRRLGINTPMKLYAYLASGRPVIATDIVSHTQVVDPLTALLVPPTVEGMVGGINRWMAMEDRGREIGAAGAKRVRAEFSREAYDVRLRRLYARVVGRGLGSIHRGRVV